MPVVYCCMALKNTQTCDRYSGHFYRVLLDQSVTISLHSIAFIICLIKSYNFLFLSFTAFWRKSFTPLAKERHLEPGPPLVEHITERLIRHRFSDFSELYR